MSETNFEMRKYIAELIGTFILVFAGCGSAILGGSIGNLGVSFAFGLSVLVMVYTIGSISGCHINPAVSLAMFLDKRLSAIELAGYVVSQVIGAIIAAALLMLVVSFGITDLTGALGANGTSGAGGIGGAFVIEIVLTFIFLLTILAVTANEKMASVAGIVIGLTLTFVHIVGIPLTGTSVNPARSIGPALFAGGSALTDVWVFILAPLVGAALAVVVYRVVIKK